MGVSADYVRLQRKFHRQISVCHIASGDAWGGAEAQIATLLKSLASRDDLRVCAIVLNDGRLASELQESGVETKVISEQEMSFGRIVINASEYLRGRKVEVIHSHRYKENLLGVLLALRYPVRLVRTQHGQPEPYAGFSGVKQRFVYAVDRQLGRHTADRVVSVSTDLTGYLRGHIAPTKVAVIRNGIALDKVHSKLTKAEAKQRLFIKADAPVIGTATRLTAIKRLDIFIETAACIAKILPGARFVIAGGGSEESRVRECISQAGLEHQVLLLGPRTDIYDVMRAMDVMLLTSDHEGLPMALLEAMALGIPVVSRKVGGIPEVVECGETGMLVDSAAPEDLAKACISVVGDDAFRKRIAANARRLIEEQYSAEKNAADVAEIYRSLVLRKA